ncbi:MAG TPA: HD domain-containing phosphohydrolase [Fimbriimonas sp.]|nr:HD domain-containing phosphohydrolase [Fimbriimonas sp.]
MKTILFVDDDASALAATQRMLHGRCAGWTLLFVQSGREAIKKLSTGIVDTVVTDVAMPGMTGLELLQHIVQGSYGFIPVVVVTGVMEKDAKRLALEIGAQDLLSKPIDYEELLARLRSTLALKELHDELSSRNERLENLIAARTEELAASRLELVVQLSKAAELRDHETGNHVLRVGMFARYIAEELGFDEEECDELFLAGTLHDVGKIAIPDSVLRKQGMLKADERSVIEEHCEIGYNILCNRDSVLSQFLPSSMKWGEQPSIMRLAAEIARWHHEWWDGTGYPDRLKGEEIPLAARIVAMADVLDALRSERPYKPAYDWQTAVLRVAAGRETQFDPSVHDAFLSTLHRIKEFDEAARRDDRFTIAKAA